MNLDAPAAHGSDSKGVREGDAATAQRAAPWERCAADCFPCHEADVGDLPVRFLLEKNLSYFEELSPRVQNAVRCLLVRAQVKTREAAHGELWCGPGRSLACLGGKLYQLIADDHFKARGEVAAFPQNLRELTTATWAQLEELYTDVAGSDLPASLGAELWAVLGEREGQWKLTFWRQLARRCQQAASAQGDGGYGPQGAPAPPISVAAGRLPSRSVISPGAASRVRDYLGKQGLRRSEFALRVGITERTLRKLLKTGRIKVAVVDQVAAEMGITKAELLAEPAGREGSG